MQITRSEETLFLEKSNKLLAITQNENIELNFENNNMKPNITEKDIKDNYSIQFSNRDGKIYEIMNDFYNSLVDFYNISEELMDAIYNIINFIFLLYF